MSWAIRAVALGCLSVVLGCEGPAAPGIDGTLKGLGPSLSVAGTSCDELEAWLVAGVGHHPYENPVWMTNGSPASSCGDITTAYVSLRLAFGAGEDSGSAVFQIGLRLRRFSGSDSILQLGLDTLYQFIGMDSITNIDTLDIPFYGYFDAAAVVLHSWHSGMLYSGPVELNTDYFLTDEPDVDKNVFAQVWRRIPAPGSLVAEPADSAEVMLNWSNGSATGQHYSVEVWVDGVVWDSLAGPPTQVLVGGLASGLHAFKVRLLSKPAVGPFAGTSVLATPVSEVSATASVQVGPSIQGWSPCSGPPLLSCTFDVELSSSAGIESWTLTGDGGVDYSGSGTTICQSHTYTTGGQKNWTLVVIDSLGQTATKQSHAAPLRPVDPYPPC